MTIVTVGLNRHCATDLGRWSDDNAGDGAISAAWDCGGGICGGVVFLGGDVFAPWTWDHRDRLQLHTQHNSWDLTRAIRTAAGLCDQITARHLT